MSKKRKRRTAPLFRREEQLDDRGSAEKAKALKSRIQKTREEIRKIQKRYPEKSKLQLLRRIRLEYGPFVAMFLILQIERNQGNKLSLEDQMFLEEEKCFLRQSNPRFDEELNQLNQTDCAARF